MVAGNISTKVLWMHLQDLARLVSGTSELENFSFLVQNDDRNHVSDGFWLYRDDLSDLVAALPPSVRSLEVDNCGYDRDFMQIFRGIPREPLHRIYPRNLANLRSRFLAVVQKVPNLNISVQRSMRIFHACIISDFDYPGCVPRCSPVAHYRLCRPRMTKQL